MKVRPPPPPRSALTDSIREGDHILLELAGRRLGTQVRRLAAVFNTPKSEDEIVRAWQWVLGNDLVVTELMSAVGEYARSGASYFPTPGKIREAALGARTHATSRDSGSSDWNQTLDGPCPVCGAVLQLAHDPNDAGLTWDRGLGRWRERTESDHQPPKRYRVLHDGWEHKRRGIQAVGDVVWPAQRAR